MATRDDGRHVEVVDDKVAEILRGKTPAQRVLMGMEMNDFIRRVVTGYIRSSHPDLNDDQVKAELARRAAL